MSAADALGALCESDRWIDKVTAQYGKPAELDELARVEGELRALAERIRALDAERAPVQAAFGAATERAASLRQRRRHLDEQLGAATAPARDLAAMQTELEKVTAALSSAEDEEVAGLLALEPLDEAEKEVRASAQPLAARRQELRDLIAGLKASGEEEVAHLRAQRAERAAALPAPLLARYERALAHAGVSGAAHVVDGRCDGCRVTLPAVDVARARALPDGEFADCPHCGRLLLC